MTFVDTNVFLRFLLADVETQQKEAKRLFAEAATGKIKLFTSIVVVFELYWVLTSFYEKQRDEAGRVLADVFAMSFIRFEQGDILRKAVGIYRTTNFDLEDAYNLAYARTEKADEFKTFDRKLHAYFKKTLIEAQ